MANVGGLYNMVFGQNQASDAILATLGLKKGDFGRFRDVWVKDGEICVYTRCGGGNREDYEDVFDDISKHPNFICDEDDDFGYTYCTFYFTFPERYKDTLQIINDQSIPSGDERWGKFLTDLEQGG